METWEREDGRDRGKPKAGQREDLEEGSRWGRTKEAAEEPKDKEGTQKRRKKKMEWKKKEPVSDGGKHEKEKLKKTSKDEE